ncbi:phage holin family protein [Streptomyces sp. SPB162]|uniref:phage holin family protein n=1 Tax=Streptomyces sp. SPB162 TaxID=2940560 RepID=UPI00240659AD|nr:phage holin family protein [Streptomyces sp. SPB162]MDF9811257.1 putative membrane protein YqjE [Streptomyces sp. SPB162]
MSLPENNARIGESDASVGELVKRASEQLSELVRGEMRLARAELTEKGKRAGLGGGLLGGAALIAVIGLQALVATAIALLALAVSVWAAAAIVTGALFVIAAVLAFLGKKQVARAVPPAPEAAIDSVKADVEEIKGRAHR